MLEQRSLYKKFTKETSKRSTQHRCPSKHYIIPPLPVYWTLYWRVIRKKMKSFLLWVLEKCCFFLYLHLKSSSVSCPYYDGTRQPKKKEKTWKHNNKCVSVSQGGCDNCTYMMEHAPQITSDMGIDSKKQKKKNTKQGTTNFRIDSFRFFSSVLYLEKIRTLLGEMIII